MQKKDNENNIEETVQFLEENETLFEENLIDESEFKSNINNYFEEK